MRAASSYIRSAGIWVLVATAVYLTALIMVALRYIPLD